MRSLEQFIHTLKGSDQFLEKECFFNLFLRSLSSNILEQLELKLQKIIGIQKFAGKVTKGVFLELIFE